MASIPDGYGVIAGRSRENAIAALAAAEAAGLEPSVVRTVEEGYLVPEAVLVEFERATNDGLSAQDDEPEDVREPDSDESESEPPRSGAGSSKTAWSKWAAENKGYDPAEDLSRDDLVERYGEKE